MNDDFSVDKKIMEKLMSENSIVPQNIHQIIIETGQNLSVKRAPNALLKYVVASLLIFTIGLFTFGITNPTYAQKIPVIGSIFKTLDQMIFSNYDSYSSDLNISSMYKGYKVTINEAAYDGISLTLAYTISSKSPLPIKPDGVSMNLEINGNDSIHNNSGIMSGYLSKDKKTFNGILETFLTKDNKLPANYIYTDIQDKPSAEFINIPDKFNLKLNIVSFYELGEKDGKRMKYEKLYGDWNFNIFITNEKLKGKVKEIKTAINLDKYEKGFRISKIITTPLNTVLLGTSPNIFNNSVDFIVFDNYGRELPGKGTCLDGASPLYYYMFTYKEINKDAKTLTFIPFRYKDKSDFKKDAINPPPEVLTSDLNLEGKTVIPLGKHGNMEITRVEVSKGRTNIYYTSPFGSRSSPLSIIDKATNQRLSVYLSMAKYLEGAHEYVATLYTTLQNKKYIIQCYNPELYYRILDDQKFTISINK